MKASGASEWSVAQVLSHLGSGSELAEAALQAALDGTDAPTDDDNKTVWARWDALGPVEQRDEALARATASVAALENLDAAQRESLQVAMSFLPAPVSVASFAGLRLSEWSLHGWDVRVAADPAAGLLEESALLVLDLWSGELSFLTGFLAKTEHVPAPAVVDLAGSGYLLTLSSDGASMGTSEGEATAVFTGPVEAAVRLLNGRLRPEFTPPSVEVSGAVSLETLREVFPGY